MELLAPAGNIEKLRYAYFYGADAAYIGLKNFSLRARADNFEPEEAESIRRMKGNKKLYAALNIFFHNRDLVRLEKEMETLALFPLDSLIISDMGCYRTIRKYFPDLPLHLSTQANCVNVEAAKFYQDLGFKRIILGREASLKEISEIRSALPDLELEIFVHGAMCLAYSGRCFLSRWMADRSANEGFCAHSCRWKYRYLEEEERPGEYYPVIEGDNFTTILSSRDICMIDYLKEIEDAGITSLKIEGRMKSLYYTAVITRAYRKALDRLSGKEVPDFSGFREELFKVSHREFSTGFYFGREEIEKPTELSYERQYRFLGVLGPEKEPGLFALDLKNQIKTGEKIEFIGPDILFIEDKSFSLYNEDRFPADKADHGKLWYIKTDKPVKEGFILRKKYK